MPIPPQTPVVGNTVQGGVFIDPLRPDVAVLRFQSGLAKFDLMLDTANLVGFLNSVVKAAEAEVAKNQRPLLRPVPGLFVPNGNGAVPPKLPGDGS